MGGDVSNREKRRLFPMGRRTVPKVAGVESQGSLILHALLTELHTAGYNWALMADVVSQGYRDAYDMHKKTLAKVKQNEESGNLQLKEMYLFVLTAVSVGFAGGLVGAAMAPWVKGVQDLASKTAFRQGFGQYILAEGSKGSA